MALSQATMTGAAMAGRRRQYLESITAACPKLTIDTDELYRSGQSNDLLPVNDELLFRFPKFAHGVAALRREQAILDAVRPHLPTATPHYTFHAPSDAKAGRAFVGYRKLAGEALWRERFAQIDDDGTIDRLAVDLASFLQALHAIPPQAIDYPLQPAETQAAWSNVFTRIRRVVYPHLNAEARDWTARQFVKFLENADSFAFANVLRHGDFGASNILYSESTRRITGIVDFGHAGAGDPAVDFAGLCVCYGEQFLRRCARVYRRINLCWKRISFYAGCAFLLEDALFCTEKDTEERDEVIDEVNRKAVGGC